MKSFLAASLFLLSVQATAAGSIVGYEQEWRSYTADTIGVKGNQHFFVATTNPLTFTQDVNEAKIFDSARDGLLFLENEAPALCHERYRKNGKFYRHCFSVGAETATKLFTKSN